MLNIAVCDDEKTILDKVQYILEKYCTERVVSHKISLYSDGSELLASPEKYDIIFLDIEMNQSNGIETAHQIRKSDMNVPIVFITGYSDYWKRAFKVHAFGFLTKPVKPEDMNDLMDDYFKFIKKRENEIVTFHTENSMLCIDMNDIYFFTFEKKRKIYVHTSSGKITVHENLSDIYNRLDKKIFYQTKRNCIVNLSHVQKLQNDYVIIMKDGTMLPLAQKKKEEFMSKLSQEFIKKIKGRNYND